MEIEKSQSYETMGIKRSQSYETMGIKRSQSYENVGIKMIMSSGITIKKILRSLGKQTSPFFANNFLLQLSTVIAIRGTSFPDSKIIDLLALRARPLSYSF